MDVRKVVVYLDSLFDLRQGCLSFLMGAKQAYLNTSTEQYFTREDFSLRTDGGILTHEEYLQLVKNHPDIILKNSLRTKLLGFIEMDLIHYRQKLVSSPINFDIMISINCDGFNLSQLERDKIIAAVTHLTSGNYRVEAVSMSDNQLNVPYVKNNVARIFRYDASQWLDKHHKALISNAPNPEFQLFVPRLYQGDKNNKEVKEELKNLKMDYFEGYATMLEPALQIGFIPVCLFSADVPTNLTSYCAI